jgi:hypothetical protein
MMAEVRLMPTAAAAQVRSFSERLNGEHCIRLAHFNENGCAVIE